MYCNTYNHTLLHNTRPGEDTLHRSTVVAVLEFLATTTFSTLKRLRRGIIHERWFDQPFLRDRGCCEHVRYLYIQFRSVSVRAASAWYSGSPSVWRFRFHTHFGITLLTFMSNPRKRRFESRCHERSADQHLAVTLPEPQSNI